MMLFYMLDLVKVCVANNLYQTIMDLLFKFFGSQFTLDFINNSTTKNYISLFNVDV